MSVGGCMRFIFLAVFLCVASNGYALTMGQAIDKAGQQRMLSQRIAQSFILTGIQPDNARYKAQLDKAIKQFQENLDTLQANNDAISIRGELLTVRNLWKPFKAVATGPVTKQNACLWRCAYSRELDYRYQDDLSRAFSDIVTRLAQCRANGDHNATLDILIGIATQKIQLSKSSLQNLINSLRHILTSHEEYIEVLDFIENDFKHHSSGTKVI